jgi:PPP family 3-phenylpropionic acid transporter
MPRVIPRPLWSCAVTFFFLYGVGGLTGPFLAPLLTRYGYSHGEVGLLLSSASVCGTLAPLVAGRLGDGRVRPDRLAQACTAAALGLALLLGWRAETPDGLLWPLFLLFSLVRAPLGSLLDGLAMGAAGFSAALYSRVRLTGSVGFIVVSSVVGWARVGTSPARFFACLILLTGLTFAVTPLLPAAPPRPPVPPDAPGFWQSLPPAFGCWLGAMMLHWFAFSPYQYGFTLLLAEARVPESWMGVIWSLGVGAEVAAFFASPWIFARFRYHRVLYWALVLSGVRWLLLGLWPTLPIIVGTQLLHGPGFALYYAAALQTLHAFGQGRFTASYQGLYASCVGGLAGVLGTALGGALHGQMPFHRVLLCMVPVQALALLLLHVAHLDAPRRDDTAASPST